ncbi:MAG TPA: hypothetical protein PKN47_01610 [Nitrospira sp.]|nr:hypothetical protein [Nitrospira sp.]
MSTLTTFQTLFDDRVRVTAAPFTSQQKERAIQQALKEYAQVRPAVAAQDYAGDGATFDLALPTGWQDGLSTIRQIEYPAGQRIPSLLQNDDWGFYVAPAGKKIRLLSITPSTGETTRVTYTTPHLIDAVSSTVSALDEEAVADLAASIGLTDLAAAFANTQSPTITADSVNYADKSRTYLDIAEKLKLRYRKHLGLDQQSDAPPTGGFVEQDRRLSDGGDLLTHPRRLR